MRLLLIIPLPYLGLEVVCLNRKKNILQLDSDWEQNKCQYGKFNFDNPMNYVCLVSKVGSYGLRHKIMMTVLLLMLLMMMITYLWMMMMHT